jgi:hypothetical protein
MGSGRARLALLALVPLLGAAFVNPASAHKADQHAVTIAFHSHFDDGGFLTGFEGVSPAPPGVPTDAVFHGSSTVTGPTLSGTVEYTFWGHPDSDGNFVFHTYETLTGSVAGCGRGTVSYTVDGKTGGSDPRAMTLTGDVSFVPGSGTGRLRAITSGHGTLTGTSSITTQNSGKFDGEVVCNR